MINSATLQAFNEAGIISTAILHHDSDDSGEKISLTIGQHQYLFDNNGKLLTIPVQINEIKLQPLLPLATRPAIVPFTDEELANLKKWLESEEGKRKMREGQEAADKIIDKLNDIDPKILREPFDI